MAGHESPEARVGGVTNQMGIRRGNTSWEIREQEENVLIIAEEDKLIYFGCSHDISHLNNHETYLLRGRAKQTSFMMVLKMERI